MFHQNLFFIQFFINILLFPLPTKALYDTTDVLITFILFNVDINKQKSI
jgi:hypothetical protein